MIKTDSLSPALAILSSAIPSKHGMTILQCVRIDSDNGIVKLTGSNMEMQIDTEINAETKGQLKTCIDAKKLGDFVKVSGKQIIDITTKDDKAILKAKSRSTIAILPYDNFPDLDVNLNDSITVTIPGKELARALSVVGSSVSVGDARFQLNGYGVVVNDGVLTIVGTNGCQLSIVDIDVVSSGNIECIIPKATGLAIAKIFSDGDITMVISKNSLSVSDGVNRLIGRNIDAKYPKYDKIFDPVREDLIIDKNELLSGIEAARLSSETSKNAVSFNIGTDALNILGYNSSGEESEIDINCQYSGSPMKIAFSAVYLSDVVKKIDGEVTISLHSSSALFLGDNKKERHIVMPMRI